MLTPGTTIVRSVLGLWMSTVLGFVAIAEAQIFGPLEEVSKLDKAETVFREALSKAEKEFQLAISSILKQTDQIELYLLNIAVIESKVPRGMRGLQWEENGDGKKFYFIPPLNARAEILKKRTLDADSSAFRSLVNLCSKQIKVSGGVPQSLAHHPTHALVFKANGKIIFQSSISVVNDSYFIDYGRYTKEFDLNNRELERAIMREMPISAEYKRQILNHLRDPFDF